MYAKSWTFLPGNCCIYGHFFDFSSPKIHMTQRALGWVAQAGACMGELAP